MADLSRRRCSTNCVITPQIPTIANTSVSEAELPRTQAGNCGCAPNSSTIFRVVLSGWTGTSGSIWRRRGQSGGVDRRRRESTPDGPAGRRVIRAWRVGAAIRGLIDEVSLEPEGNHLRIVLKGNLAGMLRLAQENKRPSETDDLLDEILLVAGAGFEPATFGL
ncbi:MAG: hypothetical protein ACM3SQ_01905 [Betaproteobacteria bacterium]